MLRLINGITSLLQAVFMGPESVLQGRLLDCAGVFAPEEAVLALGSWLCGLWNLASAEDGWCHVEALRASLGTWRQQ